MRRLILLAAMVTALVLGLLWLSGGFDILSAWARSAQREFQTALAAPLRQLKAGQGGALAALLGLAFGYGVAHAAGPGHGKLLIGGYALATRAGIARLIGLSLAASLAQATVAVALVLAGVFLAGWGRDQLRGVAENWFAPLSALSVAAIGLWLAGRGIRHLSQARRDSLAEGSHAHHAHHAHHDAPSGGHADPQAHACAHCGHAHGPTLEQAQQASDLRTALALVGGIAMRPCTGALFVLILTWQMGIAGAGIAAAYAMGLGTATVTIAAALGAAVLRDGVLAGLGRSRALALVLPLLEIASGLLIALVATTLAFGPM